jgi:5-hydroxyisourate hydrolase-like protein (transthyretin family)
MASHIIVSLSVALALSGASSPAADAFADRDPPAAQATQSQTGLRDTAHDREATGSIRGRVIDSMSGEPVRNAIVSAYAQEEGQRAAVTDTTGRFELSGLSAGKYTLFAHKAGYTSAAAEPRRPAEREGIVRIAPRESVQDVTLRLVRGAVIAGRITDQYGESAAGIMVRSFRRDGEHNELVQGEATQTDDQGRYRFFGLPSGTYYIDASPSQHGLPDLRSGLLRTFYPGVASVAGAQAIQVAVGRETDISFALAHGRTVQLSGTVTDSQGRTVSLGQVMVSDGDDTRNWGIVHGVTIGDDGRFTITNMAPGDYRLTVETGPPDSDDTESATVSVTVGTADISGVDIVSAPPALIRGMLIFDPPSSAATVRPAQLPVSAQRRTEGFWGGFSARMNEDGSFELRARGEGRVHLSQGFQWPREWGIKAVLQGGVDVTNTGVTLRPGERINDLQVVVSNRFPAVAGAVVDDRGSCAVDARVVILPEGWIPGQAPFQSYGLATTTDTGTFEVKGLRPGRYVAIAQDQEPDFQNPRFLERMRNATPFDLADGERKLLNLKLLQGQ